MSQARVIALSGGVGGAKLALGLSKILKPENLLIVANTGDDFEHFGLTICPDLDTLTYTLSGENNAELGWGRQGETWNFMEATRQLGGEAWFNLGDKDLALHVYRSQLLKNGVSLTAVNAEITGKFGIGPLVVPMCDEPVRTIVQTPDGPLAFQHYFVREQCRPMVTGFHFEGSEAALPNPKITEFIQAGPVDAVVVCPSNPFISIDPILNVPGMRDVLVASGAPVIAVSPIVGGEAVKGPTAKMMTELGLAQSAITAADYFREFIDGFVLDTADVSDEDEISALGLRVVVANTFMQSLEDRVTLAQDVLSFAQTLLEGQTS